MAVLRPGKRMIQFLESNGFREIVRGDLDMTTYYTDEVTGKQIRLDYRDREISLIEPNGKVIFTDFSIKEEDIVKFNKRVSE